MIGPVLAEGPATLSLVASRRFVDPMVQILPALHISICSLTLTTILLPLPSSEANRQSVAAASPLPLCSSFFSACRAALVPLSLCASGRHCSPHSTRQSRRISASRAEGSGSRPPVRPMAGLQREQRRRGRRGARGGKARPATSVCYRARGGG